MLAVFAIASVALASLAAAAVPPAGMRPIHPDAHLIKFGFADDQVEWISPAALELLREAHVDLTQGVDAVRAAHPELAGVSDTVINRLGNHTIRGPGFIDITGFEFVRRASFDLEARAVYPTQPTPSKYPALTSMFNSVNAAGLQSTVQTLSNGYTTRHYRSTNAAAPATWIQTQFTNAAGSANVRTIANTFNQPNVIATIPRKAGSTLDEVVILGAHLDSTVGGSTTARAPGADDGKSRSSTQRL
ncbi:hypothetical protein NLJ89_g11002 [Agrocybe chaxingu]|uniref:Peptide hydrolase n=1 Tax=Agrocybe chaxingu TaxID=84603 RepID=A0A9W8JMP8_9AGAR|nr:hypothetical protein NLJ89_g11002 [Agrocybe chaxingu]